MLTINEIFHSIQGESTYAGRPYAFHEGSKASLDDVMGRVDAYGCSLVEVTGGEPLLQEEVYPLMDRLLASGRTVLLETGGHLDTGRVPREVVKIVDVKCPGSGEVGRMCWENLDRLQPHDQVKFVILDRADYEYARGVLGRYRLEGRCEAVLFAPVHGVLDATVLAGWVLDDRLQVRVQLQVHKYIWGAEVRGV
jgi:7-carboxy-7-deazaguanine synthase